MFLKYIKNGYIVGLASTIWIQFYLSSLFYTNKNSIVINKNCLDTSVT